MSCRDSLCLKLKEQSLQQCPGILDTVSSAHSIQRESCWNLIRIPSDRTSAHIHSKSDTGSRKNSLEVIHPPPIQFRAQSTNGKDRVSSSNEKKHLETNSKLSKVPIRRPIMVGNSIEENKDIDEFHNCIELKPTEYKNLADQPTEACKQESNKINVLVCGSKFVADSLQLKLEDLEISAKKIKSVKFNLSSQEIRRQESRTTATALQYQHEEESEPATRNAAPRFGNEGDLDQETTLAGFVRSIIPDSWTPSHLNIPGISQSSNLLVAAYDMGSKLLNSGIQFANSMLNIANMEYEPREDVIRYNGYTIRIYGRELLLQSIFFNCDRHQEYGRRCANKERCPSTSSSTTASDLNNNGGFGCSSSENTLEVKKIRIIIQVTNAANAQKPEHGCHSEVQPVVTIEQSKWILLYRNVYDGQVEIQVPPEVAPGSLAFRGLREGLIVIDIP